MAVDTVSDTAPASPATGETWFNTDTGTLAVWDGSKWRRALPDPTPTAPGPVSVSVADLGVALRVASTGQPIDADNLGILTRLGGVGEAMVAHLAPNAPVAIKAEAVIRLAGYLYDTPESPSGIRYAQGWANSGAAALVAPWQSRRAVFAPDAVIDGIVDGGGVPSGGGGGVNADEVNRLIAAYLAANPPTGPGGGLTAVVSDSSLRGAGTAANPLGVDNVFSAADEAKLDSLQQGLLTVESDATLAGDGTAAAPLRVASPYTPGAFLDVRNSNPATWTAGDAYYNASDGRHYRAMTESAEMTIGLVVGSRGLDIGYADAVASDNPIGGLQEAGTSGFLHAFYYDDAQDTLIIRLESYTDPGATIAVGGLTVGNGNAQKAVGAGPGTTTRRNTYVTNDNRYQYELAIATRPFPAIGNDDVTLDPAGAISWYAADAVYTDAERAKVAALTGGLTAVASDATLTGDGTAAAPLMVARPVTQAQLNVLNALPVQNSGNAAKVLGFDSRGRYAVLGRYTNPNAILISTAGLTEADDGEFPAHIFGVGWNVAHWGDTDIEFSFNSNAREWTARGYRARPTLPAGSNLTKLPVDTLAFVPGEGVYRVGPATGATNTLEVASWLPVAAADGQAWGFIDGDDGYGTRPSGMPSGVTEFIQTIGNVVTVKAADAVFGRAGLQIVQGNRRITCKWDSSSDGVSLYFGKSASSPIVLWRTTAVALTIHALGTEPFTASGTVWRLADPIAEPLPAWLDIHTPATAAWAQAGNSDRLPAAKLPPFLDQPIHTGTGVGQSITSSGQTRRQPFQRFSPVFDLDDADKQAGVLTVEAVLHFATRSDTTIGFGAGNDQTATIAGFTFAQTVRGSTAYSATANNGDLIGSLDVYEGATKLGVYSLYLAKDANNQLGYWLLYAGEAQSENWAVAVQRLEVAFTHQDSGPGGAVQRAFVAAVGANLAQAGTAFAVVPGCSVSVTPTKNSGSLLITVSAVLFISNDTTFLDWRVRRQVGATPAPATDPALGTYDTLFRTSGSGITGENELGILRAVDTYSDRTARSYYLTQRRRLFPNTGTLGTARSQEPIITVEEL